MSILSPVSRRNFLQLAGIAGVSWLTPVSHLLARAAEASGQREQAQSIIVLWMQGGPEPARDLRPAPGHTHRGRNRSHRHGRSRACSSPPGLERTAEEMRSICLIRSMVSKEGDHERGTYTMKTGFRPDPTVVHPSIGAIVCHELPMAGTDIPRHVSILPGQWPARGGYLGDQYNAFRTDDPAGPVADTASLVAGSAR